jgi:ABC-type transport system involved in cytochrome bd biosynthesis fused ATPase/permease subunit
MGCVGRIAEQGSHDQLMERDGIYRQLMTLQMAGFATPTATPVPTSALN